MDLVKKLEATLASLPSHWKSDIEAVSEAIAALQVGGEREELADLLMHIAENPQHFAQHCDEESLSQLVEASSILRAPVAVTVDGRLGTYERMKETLPEAFTDATDRKLLDWIQKYRIAVSPQCNGGWVIEKSGDIGDMGDADVIELARTRGTLREALSAALAAEVG